jgi:4-alpha-glucanotransferase
MIDRIRPFGSLSKEEALSLHAPEELVFNQCTSRGRVLIYPFLPDQVALSQEDLFGEKKQLNLPGTINTFPNWSGKMSYSIEDLRTDPEAQKRPVCFGN